MCIHIVLWCVDARFRKTRMMMNVWTVYAGRLMRTDKNLDISTLITRGCFFGTYYLTASTLPLGLATTWWIWTLPTCFPTALCMCMVWWKCRYSQPGRFEWLCIDFFYNTPFASFDVIASIQFRLFFFDKWAHGCRGSVADFVALSRWTFHVSFSTDQRCCHHEILIERIATVQGHWSPFRDNITTCLWELLPHPISPIMWLTFYHAQRDFVGRLHGALLHETTMYIHGLVSFPTSIIPYP